MSHLQHVLAHSLYLRACAKSLQAGDAEAREEAARLIAQAAKLEAKPQEAAHA